MSASLRALYERNSQTFLSVLSTDCVCLGSDNVYRSSDSSTTSFVVFGYLERGMSVVLHQLISAPHVSWILSGDLPRLLMYIDYSVLVRLFLTVYAPWGDGPGGLVLPDELTSQDDLLRQVANHMVEMQIELRYLPDFCPGIEAFVAFVVSIEIVP
ncbi:uncharacterized protein ARMOST_09166 [Armillaria ostoyae]|uniref:Uncharacterized protein n=1 Tax=Armillaria ostoyae TaxID=47428 RepID=A0A284RAN8_ARMOS|nr:uncharacterized protein ARMOST_09166 [Armillaria ostoyae]